MGTQAESAPLRSVGDEPKVPLSLSLDLSIILSGRKCVKIFWISSPSIYFFLFISLSVCRDASSHSYILFFVFLRRRNSFRFSLAVERGICGPCFSLLLDRIGRGSSLCNSVDFLRRNRPILALSPPFFSLGGSHRLVQRRVKTYDPWILGLTFIFVFFFFFNFKKIPFHILFIRLIVF